MEHIEINGNSYTFEEYYIPDMTYDCNLLFRGRPAGTATLSLIKNFKLPDSDYPSYYFNRHFVNPEFRGNHLGSFILERILDFARREKKSIINEINPYGEMGIEQLTDFYVRHGFKILSPGVVFWSPG